MQLKKRFYLAAIAVLSIVLAGGIIGAIVLRSTLLGDSWQVPVSTEKTLKELSQTTKQAQKQATSKPKEDSGITTIVLSGDGAEITGEGANFYGGVLTIREGGNYSLSGELENGQIVVNIKDRDAVTLYLNGVKVYNSYDPALEVKSAGHTLLVTQKETINRLQSGAKQPVIPIGEGEGSGAAIYSKNDLFLAGDGVLQVLGYINNGIQADGSLAIESGEINVVAVNTALKSGYAVIIRDGEFMLNAGGDGIRADGSGSEGQGSISISDGRFSLKCGGDGMQAATLLDISNGVYTIDSGAGLAEARQGDADNTPSAKGLKSGEKMRLAECSLSIQSPDDAIHSGGELLFAGASSTLHTEKTGVYAAGALNVTVGTLHIVESAQGMEGAPVNIRRGDLFISSAGSGIHSAARGAQDSHDLTVSGGHLEIDSGEHALFSEGNLLLKGGSILINNPPENEMPALRYHNGPEGCRVGSATLLIADSNGMQDTSCLSRNYIVRRFATPLQPESKIILSTRNNSVLFEHTLKHGAASFIFSSPALYGWRSYRLIAGGLESEPALRRGSRASWLERFKWWD